MRRLLFRTVGFCVIGLGLALLIAMASYDSTDPSWNSSGKAGEIHNWLGSFGSHAADLSWQFFGYAGALLPLILLAWGWRLFQGAALDRLHWRLMAALGAVVSFACLLAMIQLSPLSGGAFGALAIRTMPQFLLADWGLYPSLFMLAVVSGGLIYLACALSVSEWGELFVALHQAALFAFDKFLALAEALGKVLRNDRSLTDDLDDDLEAEDEPEASVDKPKKVRTRKTSPEPRTYVKKPKPADWCSALLQPLGKVS